MAINTTTFESTLQTKLDDTTLAAKEMLLLGKALESTVGSIAVSDINTAGAAKVSEVNALATSTFKTVGGTSILGSGDIATLPSQSGASGKVLKSDGTNAAWGTDAEGKVLQIKRADATGTTTGSRNTSGDSNYQQNFGNTHCSIDFTPISSTSIIVVNASAPCGVHGNDLAVAGIWNGASNCLAVGLTNGYSADASGMSLTGSFVSGSTATRNISFRIVGSWGGNIAGLGVYRSPSSYNMANTFGNIMVMEVEQ